jgi:hypothetical protein
LERMRTTDPCVRPSTASGHARPTAYAASQVTAGSMESTRKRLQKRR